jgi:penicillin amidase
VTTGDRTRRGARIATILVTALLGALVLLLQTSGLGPVPALGPVLDPTTGVLNLGARAALPTSATLHPAGIPDLATVRFGSQGIAEIHADSQAALWYTMGYVEGRNRLFEMDLLRREAGGTLAAVLGPSYLASDEFELRLGLARAAARNLAALPAKDRQILDVFSAGVNAARSYDLAHHALPPEFRLLGYVPAPWQPVDSMLVQEFLTQDLNYTQEAVDASILVAHLGYRATMQIFPLFAANGQHPYDTGPYTGANALPADPSARIGAKLLASLDQLAAPPPGVPSYALHLFSDSNNWAIAPSHSATGHVIVAGDPHLTQTLPAIWYWVQASAPGISFTGVAVPGLPIILIGRNAHIAWSETDVEDQATFFYHEITSPSHPGEYLFDGTWHRFQNVTYHIKVKGAKTKTLVVHITNNGPIMTIRGDAVAVWWLGDKVSKDFESLMGVLNATNWHQFVAALSLWRAPAQNFVYGDNHGNIGMISAGAYPQFKRGDPWLVMSGSGGEEPSGYIPYPDVPHAYNPPTGFVFSANQRPVTAAYPYYVGTSFDFYSNGFRADEIHHVLAHTPKVTVADVERLQSSVTDYLATKLVPWLVASFHGVHPSPAVAQAVTRLAHWNDSMGVHSVAASLWWTFLGNDLRDTFGPLFAAHHVPEPKGSALALTQLNTPLLEDLQHDDLADPHAAIFTPPGSTTPRSAQTVARIALDQSVAELAHQLGPNESTWQWGRLHFRQFQSLTGVRALGYGPRGSSGDDWTVDAAEGNLLAHVGPSWRMIVAFGDKGLAIYPGGQSENPLSPWYENLIPYWWSGHYLPFGLAPRSSIATWRLEPE